MKEIKSIIEAYHSIDFNTARAALATVARVEGSSYRRTGARMLVLDNGTYLGGISGGCLEGDALRRAQKAIAQNKASVITYDTTQEDGAQIGVGLGCNGIIDVLFTPLHTDEFNIIDLLSGIVETRMPRIIISVTGGDHPAALLGQAILYAEEENFRERFALASITANVIQDIKTALDHQASATHVYDADGYQVKLLIEVIPPVTHLVLYGSNYDIYTMVRMATELGWNTTVVTNLQKADKALFASATKLLSNKGPEQPVIDAYTAVMLMAHDYKTDFNNLRYVLTTAARYIGLLGPRKRGTKMFDALQSEGQSVSPDDMQRIYSPAGLDIGATTPEEIAVSVVAEVKSCFAHRQGMNLRLREGTIYGN